MGGAEKGKDVQGTIKILLGTDFTSDLAHFLHNIVGAQLNIGGAQALPKRYKVTLMGGGGGSRNHIILGSSQSWTIPGTFRYG